MMNGEILKKKQEVLKIPIYMQDIIMMKKQEIII